MQILQANESLNAICPYFTMFPLSFPRKVLARHASSGSRVLDPFCGRGTTNLAARLLGHESLGVDSSPVAFAITQAKLASSNPTAIVRCAREILEKPLCEDPPSGAFWRLAFHPKVLDALCRFRQELKRDCRSESRKALRGVVLGALHGPLQKTVAGYFSNQYTRSYSPKPAYAVRYWKLHNLKPPEIDVLSIIERRALRFFVETGEMAKGFAALGDSRCESTLARAANGKKFDWTITSPPYYGMRTYVQDQWLRYWFLGGPSIVEYQNFEQLEHCSPELFSEQLAQVWRNASVLSKDGARLVIRFGGIGDRKADPLEILRRSLADSPWRITTTVAAGLANRGKRQADVFLKKGSSPVQEYDVWARLC